MNIAPQIIIAIDPDTARSGVAVIHTDQPEVDLYTLTFAQTIQFIQDTQQRAYEHNKTLAIVIEAAWLNKANWHLNLKDTKRQAAAKGYSVGRNHQVGLLIHQYCEENLISAHLVKPLRKMWRGPNKKITHQEITHFMPINKNTTNQEERDAALLAWHYANRPIRVKALKP